MANIDIALEVTKAISPVLGIIIELTAKSAGLVDKASEEGIEKLQDEMAKETLRMQFALQQARIAQELAIAKRIENAHEVEIEEFYDTSGKGQVGLNVDAEKSTLGLGIGAEGRKITKRVYHFRGVQSDDEGLKMIEQS